MSSNGSRRQLPSRTSLMANRGRFPARGPRRLTQWIGPAVQGYVSVTSGAKVAVSSFTPQAATPSANRPTVVRTRGMISIIPGAFSASVSIVGAVGCCIVSSDALAVGITAIPGPFSDSEWGGWFVWHSFAYRFEFDDATGVQFPNWNWQVDSKAMRKVGPNEALVQVAESQSGAFDIAAPLRTLVKLS